MGMVRRLPSVRTVGAEARSQERAWELTVVSAARGEFEGLERELGNEHNNTVSF